MNAPIGEVKTVEAHMWETEEGYFIQFQNLGIEVVQDPKYFSPLNMAPDDEEYEPSLGVILWEYPHIVQKGNLFETSEGEHISTWKMKPWGVKHLMAVLQSVFNKED